MRRVTVGCLAAILCLLAALAASRPAMASRVTAYVLTETDDAAAVPAALSSLPGCKALTTSLMPGEVIVHLACDKLANLNEVVANIIPQIEGVSRTAIWLIRGDDEE